MGSIKQNLANNILSGGKFDATDLDGTIPNTNINDNSIDNVTSFPAAGSGIPSVASDPPSPSQGDVWYNTTSNAFKYVGATTVGSWATGGSLNTARQTLGSAGTQTSSLAFGGLPVSVPAGDVITESYNGSTWTEVADLNQGRYTLQGAGSDNTSAIAFGGAPGSFANTESWNGTSWTEVNDLNTGRNNLFGSGTATSALAAGGEIAPPTAITESWNGTSWSETGDLNQAREYAGMASADNTSALAFGGLLRVPSISNVASTESFNGTSWTEVNDLNTARRTNMGMGIQTSALSAGGNGPSITGVTEEWDGTSWTEVADLSTARASSGQGGNTTAGLIFGGSPPTTGATEEWNGAGSPVTKTVTTA